MNSTNNPDFWDTLESLFDTHKLIIDRPRGERHPRYPDLVYPLDYGYLEGTRAADGDGIDVWVGSLPEKTLTGILCSFDTCKNDAEIKLLLGCSPADVETIMEFNSAYMRFLFVPRPHPDQKETV
jgi:inorganic pyrophosphatase